MLKKIGYTFTGFIIIVVFGVAGFINFAPQFGASSEGAYLKRLQESSHYKDGHFQNLVETNMDMSFGDALKLFPKVLFPEKDRSPEHAIPTELADLSLPEISSDTGLYITWFGHSAVLLEIEGKKILLDPMLGPSASPVPFMVSRYTYRPPIDFDKIPAVDAIMLSHDHYDHLDYSSIMKLKDRVGHFYVPLGVGAHLRSWGVATESITELDWWESAPLEHLQLTAAPARHFSGRGFSDRNTTLWASWVIKGKNRNVYFSGDGGYADHFKEIGEKLGPFDFAMIECGQYNENWKAIHMMPEQSVQAFVDLKGKVMMPIHWGAFTLAFHTWIDPVVRVRAAAEKHGVDLVHPVIGHRFSVLNERPRKEWWK